MAVAFVVISCKSKLGTTKGFDISQVPTQVVCDMFIVQTDKGNMQLRMEAPRMEKYETDTSQFELFPEGIKAYAYDEKGLLETEVVADQARHDRPEKGEEVWKAYGNVCVRNLIKHETMETDTLYWDKENERIYTDCYVKLLSPQGFMQGYGMESDQRARSSILYKEFNSYGLVDQDTTAIVIDTVNFIGPFQKKE